ncbi:uncharacterized protein LOC144660049 [Oculina patagonica]
MINEVIIHEADMKDLDLRGKSLPTEEQTKRLFPDHVRLCAAKESRFQSKDAFKGRFSENAIILPRTFRTVSCQKSNKTSQASRGQHCLGIMDCQETKTSRYFIVYDPAKRKSGRCIVHQIAKLNSVPVDCSCLWPRLLGDDPSVLLGRHRN